MRCPCVYFTFTFVEIVQTFSAVFLLMHLILFLVLEDFLDGNGKSQKHDSMFINSHYIRLFLVEGIATVIYGVALWFILPDCKCQSPSDPKLSYMTNN